MRWFPASEQVCHVDHRVDHIGPFSGFIASKIVDKTGQGFFLDLILGIVGAIVGGFIFSALGASGITGLNLYSMVVAVIGAVACW